jgi:hypothetical protein
MRCLLPVLLRALTIAACSPKKAADAVPTFTLLPDTTFTELGDSSFLSDHVVCVDVLDDQWYISDYKDALFVLDKDFNLVKKIGRRGEGPGEFLGAAHFYLKGKDSLYIVNERKRALDLYVKGLYTRQISLSREFRYTQGTRFFAEDEWIYHTVFSDSLHVVLFDDEGTVEKCICPNTPLDKADFRHHSSRHLAKGDGCFFVVGRTLPICQAYSMDGRLLGEYDLTQIPEIEQAATKYRNTPQVPNTYSITVQDIFYSNHKLYLLIGTNDGRYFCNTLCVLDVSDKIRHSHTFKLSGKIYQTFCVSEDNILLANNPMIAGMDVFNLQPYYP